MKMGWIKNSAGKPDAMLSLAVASFSICAFAILAPILNGAQIPLTNYTITLGSPDTALVIAFLGATFPSYIIRRNKKDQIESDEIRETIKNGIIK